MHRSHTGSHCSFSSRGWIDGDGKQFRTDACILLIFFNIPATKSRWRQSRLLHLSKINYPWCSAILLSRGITDKGEMYIRKKFSWFSALGLDGILTFRTLAMLASILVIQHDSQILMHHIIEHRERGPRKHGIEFALFAHPGQSFTCLAGGGKKVVIYW